MEPARIYGILAPEANKVILFRRGPTKLTLQLVWDLETDEITPGQWIRGTVYVERCDVSPDGRYLVAAIAHYSRKRYESGDPEFWTAISRPPYFTAVAFWESYGSYDGGGIWKSNTHVCLNNLIVLDESFDGWIERKGVQSPVTASLLNSRTNFEANFLQSVLERRGWTKGEKFADLELGDRLWEAYSAMTLTADPEPVDSDVAFEYLFNRHTHNKDLPNGRICLSYLGNLYLWQFYDMGGSLVKYWTTLANHPFWLEVDHHGWPIFSEKGCLYRWTDFPYGEPTLVADLNHYTFEPVAPPAWATKW